MTLTIAGLLSILLIIWATPLQAGWGQSALPQFPRLGMWWPDPWVQSLSDIARYDWVILSDDAAEFIGPLKTLHPGIRLLNSTNGCELSFNPDGDADPDDNREVLAVPHPWFLTQVGSTLTSAVNATATTLHVAAVTVFSGAETIDLFVPNEAVLIEDETVWVKSVDKAKQILTVNRGYVRPASAHESGVRVAAHITFWPGSWLLNLSTQCPKAVAKDGAGLEIWADYNARKAVARVQSAAWDGILLDRTDPDQSWLIGNSTARTIDPDQSNRLPASYSEFDRQWNIGLRRYESRIRDGVGPDKIIFPNLGMPNFDLLNGNNFEGAPRSGIDMEEWRQLVFGPDFGPTAGYAQWIQRGRQPNLTMIETYEDDDGPDPGGTGDYDNPCIQPGFIPNYRKMRFGLATALLNDGYYSYEINTNGHGALCLMWFDEYDNAGKGRGYLGTPQGAAFPAVDRLTSPNLLPDSTFETSTGGWDLWTDAGYQAIFKRDTQTAGEGTVSARIEISQSHGEDWRVSFSHESVPMVSKKPYTLSFWAKADAADRPVSAWIQQHTDPWDAYLHFGEIQVGTDWRWYQVSAAAVGSDPSAMLIFGLGEQTGTVWLDDIRLQPGANQVWRRDYTHGTVLVNATPLNQTVRLGSVHHRINGRQDPVINNGRTVETVTLPPFDGLILLKCPTTMPLMMPLLLE